MGQAMADTIKPMLETLAERLTYIFKNSPVSKADAARACNVTPQAVTGWIKTGRISKRQIFILADMTGFNAEWIATGKGPEKQDWAFKEASRIYSGNMVPVISKVAAGSFCEAIDEFPVGHADEYLPCPSPHGPRTFALVVDGDSMTSPYPTEKSYPHGTICFFDPDKAYSNGSKVVAKLPSSNEVTFKRLVMDSGRTYLMPLNPRYEAIDISSEIHICGTLIGSYNRE